MNKYKAKLASLLLFFTIFAPGMAIGMEKEGTGLPQDVKKIIATKGLRVILDEVQDNPAMLLEQQWRGSKSIMETISTFSRTHEKAPLIDSIVVMIQNGADSNIKNYEGNTALHLFLATLYATASPSALKEKGTFTELTDFIIEKERKLDSIKETILPKIEFLVKKYHANINAQNNLGNTIAHGLATFIAQNTNNKNDPEGNFSTMMVKWFLEDGGRNFVRKLQDMGLDFSIKNNNGQTACDILLSIPDRLKALIDWSSWAGKACLSEDEYYKLLESKMKMERQRGY